MTIIPPPFIGDLRCSSLPRFKELWYQRDHEQLCDFLAGFPAAMGTARPLSEVAS